jgi:NAD(P)H dehydrogenase (quinone)
MSVLVTIDHPWSGSFNYAILRSVLKGLESAGHRVDVLDLQAEAFNPVMSTAELEVYHTGKYLDPQIGEYQRRVAAASHLVFIFPVWWETMPARLKGWFDRVFLPEWAFAEADAAPLLTHIRSGTAITTMGAPRAVHTSVEEALLKGTLEMVGVQRTRWLNICEVGAVSDAARRAFLAQVEEYCGGLE